MTQVNPCIEIPFVDGPEGACTNTVTHKAYIVPTEQWVKQRPYKIMLDAEDWTKIKLDWLKGCRMLIRDGQKCAVAVDSVDRAIKQLNSIGKSVAL